MTWCWPNGVTDPYNPPPLGAGYGPRAPIQTPGGWTGSFHTGLDFRNYFTTVKSVGPGKVVYVGDRGTGNGLEVVVDHGTWLSRYYHLASRKADIFVGVIVDGGRALGIMGATGKAKGIHLHLRFDAQGTPSATAGQSFDPLPLLLTLLREQAGLAGGGGTIPIDPNIEPEDEDDDMPVMRELIQTPDGTVWYCYERILRYALEEPRNLATYQAHLSNLGHSPTIVQKSAIDAQAYGSPVFVNPLARIDGVISDEAIQAENAGLLAAINALAVGGADDENGNPVDIQPVLDALAAMATADATRQAELLGAISGVDEETLATFGLQRIE